MKFLVNEMPYYREDCPFNKVDNRSGDDYCVCGNTTRICGYFEMGRDPYYCKWLKEIEND